MRNSLKQGMNISLDKTITADLIAANQNLGPIEYVSTPSLILLMEQACNELIDAHLSQVHTSICAEINIKHLKPCGVGTKVNTSVHLKYIDEEKLFFDFVILDLDKEVIAIGAHERVIVNKNNLIYS